MSKEERLEAFEKMLQNVNDRYSDIISKMEKLKVEGKIKSVTYNQLMTEKLALQKIISMYEIYGLIER